MTAPTTQGLIGLKGFVKEDAFATPEDRLGGPADPRHAQVGEQIGGSYPWEVFPGETHGPYGSENELFGMDICSYIEPSGYLAEDPTSDQTPLTHAAPWPKGLSQSNDPDAVAETLRQSASIHASNLGASREMLYEPTLNATQDDWRLIDELNSGETLQDPNIPPQLKNNPHGWGSRDRVSTMAQQNEFGFDQGHMQRRYAAGSIPGNYMWMEPGSRPMVKSIPGTAIIPNGPDSPFYGGPDPTAQFGPQGAALQVLPQSYVPPPEPALASSYPSNPAPTVDFW